ncbi:MAG: multifunctional transcriptional regulator/nicotinamide-nucleotide adenylyltransferase/ribosylnicotinamide kinase NadR [Lachnospiraceae bacterium]|nr:multifunctional transcriptional regulator/nicotinamide-nucleotide adenylyltransferase/ribosylnicotinamide kinase NadR [Lachnospiraceae bacterium]
MRYKTGMYGGSFDPLHIGHLNCIIQAASMCEELYVVLSYSRERDHVPMEIRFRWIYNSFLHMQNVHIVTLEDNYHSKAEYDSSESAWKTGRDYVVGQIGRPVDVVFCGSDYMGTQRYEKLYGCEVVYFDRELVPVSATQIRSNPFQYWEYIPTICRPYYVKKVLLIGGESTGKSTLTQNLALAYNTNFVEEVGREVCDRAGGIEEMMIEEDFQEILLRHKLKELEALKSSNRVLFVDTDALITKFFSHFLLTDPDSIRRNDMLADAITGINKFDLILFLEPTVEFVQDGTRNEKIRENREMYSRQIKDLFDKAGMQYHCIGGDYQNRFVRAKELVDSLICGR